MCSVGMLDYAWCACARLYVLFPLGSSIAYKARHTHANGVNILSPESETKFGWMILNSHKYCRFLWLLSPVASGARARSLVRSRSSADIKPTGMTANSFLNHDVNTWRDAWMVMPECRKICCRWQNGVDVTRTCRTACATHSHTHSTHQKHPTEKVFRIDVVCDLLHKYLYFLRSAWHCMCALRAINHLAYLGIFLSRSHSSLHHFPSSLFSFSLINMYAACLVARAAMEKTHTRPNNNNMKIGGTK